jgi:hypothetical protein
MAEDETNIGDGASEGSGLSEAGVGMSGREGAGESVPGSAKSKLGKTFGDEAEEVAEGGARPGDWNPGEHSGGGGEVY